MGTAPLGYFWLSSHGSAKPSQAPTTLMPSDPTFHFRIYVYIQLIVTKLGIFKGVTLHSHMITNHNCKCSLNMYLAYYSTDLLCSTCKITLQKEAVTEVLLIRKVTRQEVSEKVLEGRKGCNQLNLKTWVAVQ